MNVYKLTTYSHEEHQEIWCCSHVVLTQEQLNEKFQRIMVAVGTRNKLGQDIDDNRTFGSVFYRIQDTDLQNEGLARLRPVFTSEVNGWTGPDETDLDRSWTAPSDVTNNLVDLFVEHDLKPEPFDYSKYTEVEPIDFGETKES